MHIKKALSPPTLSSAFIETFLGSLPEISPNFQHLLIKHYHSNSTVYIIQYSFQSPNLHIQTVRGRQSKVGPAPRIVTHPITN